MEDPLRSWLTTSLLKVCSKNPPTQPRSGSQRIVNRMMDYDFVVEYRPGKENISDYTSRHPMPPHECSKFELRTTKEVRNYVNYVVTCSAPKAVTRDQVKNTTEEDPALQALKKYINQGWIDTNDRRTHEFRQVFHELTIVDGIVLRGDRIVVPAKLRHRMVGIAHEGHQGQVRTKQLLRAEVWFPGSDRDTERRHTPLDRPRRKTRSTKDTKYQDFICE